MCRCRGRDERIVSGAPADAAIRQSEHEVSIRPRPKPEIRIGEPSRQEFAHDRARRSMRRRQSGEYRVRFERTVLDQANPSVELTSRCSVIFVPRSERGDDSAGVGDSQRRIRSRVSRTSTAVSVGGASSVTATTPRPCFSKRIAVAAISISKPESLAWISSVCPGKSPSASRSGFGTTILPAASMVAFMARVVPSEWHRSKEDRARCGALSEASGRKPQLKRQASRLRM